LAHTLQVSLPLKIATKITFCGKISAGKQRRNLGGVFYLIQAV
jgi:hypothetical protein